MDESDGPTSTGVGTDGTTSTRAIDNDGGATSEQENSSSRLISVEDSFDIVGGGPRTGAAPTRVIDSSERLSDPLEDRSEEEVEPAEPTRVMDSSERSSDQLGHQTATPGRDPEEAAIEDVRVVSSPARVNDTSEPEDRQLMATS